VTVDNEVLAQLKAVRDRFAHQLPEGASMADVIAFMAKVTAASAPENKPVRVTGSRKTSLPTSVVRTRYIPTVVKRAVWRRDGGACSFVSKINGKTCGSRHRLQMDHIRPFSMGGKSDEPENLRLLCFQHNQAERVRVLGSAASNRV
jgi:5-methylcytosine-specific restriction endonuclease McrA